MTSFSNVQLLYETVIVHHNLVLVPVVSMEMERKTSSARDRLVCWDVSLVVVRSLLSRMFVCREPLTGRVEEAEEQAAEEGEAGGDAAGAPAAGGAAQAAAEAQEPGHGPGRPQRGGTRA